MSRPTLFTALRSARREIGSPAAGARSFGRAAIFTGLLVLGRALWLRAASRRFKRLRGSRVGALGTPRVALPPGGASAGPASSGASWSTGRRPTSDEGGSSRAGGTDEQRPGAARPRSSDTATDPGWVDGTAEPLPPEASA